MHAEYNQSCQYIPHRAVQAYQLSQFIQHLTKPSDAVIVCGDMNCEPSQLFYRVIKDVTGLVDAWEECGKIKVSSTPVRGEGNSNIKKAGVLVVSLRGVNFRF